MSDESGPFFESLKCRLVNHSVSFRRLACAYLLLYVDCEPGDDGGVTIWFDPIWHLVGPAGVLLGSTQAAEASMLEVEGAMDAVVDPPLAFLTGRVIENITIDLLSFDLCVSFEGGYCVKTFVADATVDESWHIRENATGHRLTSSPRGLFIVRDAGEWGMLTGEC